LVTKVTIKIKQDPETSLPAGPPSGGQAGRFRMTRDETLNNKKTKAPTCVGALKF